MIRAEFIRTRWTLTMLLPVILVVLTFPAMLYLFGVSVTRIGASHMYAAALALPLAGTIAVVGEQREHRTRAGGTLWRRSNRWELAGARLLVAVTYAALGHLLMTPVLGVGWEFVVVSTVVFFTGWAFGYLCWALLGPAALIVAPAVALATNLAGAVQATNPYLPWAWPVRATCPIYGLEGSSVPAEPDSYVWSINIWHPTLALLGLAAVMTVVAVLLPRRSFTPREARVSTLPTSTRHSVIRAVSHPLPWRLWCALAVVLVAVLAAVRALRFTSWAVGLWAFLGVPIAATVVATLTWSTHSPAWRNLRLHSRRGRLVPAMIGVDLAFLIPVQGVAGIVSGATGQQIATSVFVTTMILAVVFTLSMYNGAVATVCSGVATVWSIMVGGDVLAGTPLWWTSGWSWTWTAGGHPERTPAILAVCAVVSGVAFWAAARRSRSSRLV